MYKAKIFFYFFIFISTLNSNEINKDIFLSSYIKGINLADANGKLIINKKNFFIEVNAFTVGIFSIVSNWKQNIRSEGFFEQSNLRSYFYKSDDSRGNKKGHMYLSFENNSPKIISAQPDPRNDDRRKKLNIEQLKNTFDPVIGILNIGLNGNCNYSSNIFDGKRKYKITSQFISKEKLKSGNFFKKDFDTIKCKFDIEKIAGYTEKELKKYPSSGNIWFKKIEEVKLYFPAKIEINSTWGSFVSLIKEREIKSESNNM